MTHVSLFSGVGGIDLAAEWAGFETIAQVERDPYCLAVLAKHWPDIHRCSDIHDFPDQDYGAVDLVSGGPPCQSASTAGKRRGRADDRWLWPEFARIVECLLPRWILAENPLGILSVENGMAIEEWIARVETAGYAFLPPLVYPLAALGADHRRYRVFFVAHLDGRGRGASKVGEQGIGDSSEPRHDCETPPHAPGGGREVIDISAGSRGEREGEANTLRDSEVAADPDSKRREDLRTSEKCLPGGQKHSSACSWWDARSRLLRMVHGIRGRMDGHRIKMLGNSVSPQQAYPILKAIAEVEQA